MNPTKTINQVRDSLRSQCEQVEKDENKFTEYAYHVPAWVLGDLADDLDTHLAERDAENPADLQRAIDYIHVLVSSSHLPGWRANREQWAIVRKALLAQPSKAQTETCDALEDALFQISVRLGIERETDMDAMDWHTDLISRAQYLANRDAELIGLYLHAQPAEPTAERDMLFRAINRARTAISMWENGHAFDSHGVSREIQRDIDAAHEFMLGAKPASEPVVPDGMWQIANLIDRLTEIKNRFGNTCVWFKKCSWGAEALHAKAEHDEAMIATGPKEVS